MKLIGQYIVMPEPRSGDSWTFGNFSATVIDVLDDGICIVEDQDSDTFEIHSDRVMLSIAHAEMRELYHDLIVIGMGDNDDPVQGSDCVDTVCNHFSSIEDIISLIESNSVA